MATDTYNRVRKEAERLLRHKFGSEHRRLYLEFRGELGRKEYETAKEYSLRLSRAYAKATTKLKHLYPSEYGELFQKIKNDRNFR